MHYSWQPVLTLAGRLRVCSRASTWLVRHRGASSITVILISAERHASPHLYGSAVRKPASWSVHEHVPGSQTVERPMAVHVRSALARAKCWLCGEHADEWLQCQVQIATIAGADLRPAQAIFKHTLRPMLQVVTERSVCRSARRLSSGCTLCSGTFFACAHASADAQLTGRAYAGRFQARQDGFGHFELPFSSMTYQVPLWQGYAVAQRRVWRHFCRVRLRALHGAWYAVPSCQAATIFERVLKSARAMQWSPRANHHNVTDFACAAPGFAATSEAVPPGQLTAGARLST